MDSIVFVMELVYILMGLIVVLHAKVSSLALNKSRDHAAMTSHTTTLMAEPHAECLFLGSLDISLHLRLNNSYNEKYNKYSTILHAPAGGSIPADCSAGRAEVLLLSDDGEVAVRIVFKDQNATDSDDAQSWTITKLALLTKDDSDRDINNEAFTKRGFERTTGLLMFQTPYNRTIVCDANQRVVFHSDRAHASLVFSHVNMQPPRAVRGQWSKGFTCPEPVHEASAEARNAQIFVPVILSVSLAVVVSLLVIGYLIHRKIEATVC